MADEDRKAAQKRFGEALLAGLQQPATEQAPAAPTFGEQLQGVVASLAAAPSTATASLLTGLSPVLARSRSGQRALRFLKAGADAGRELAPESVRREDQTPILSRSPDDGSLQVDAPSLGRLARLATDSLAYIPSTLGAARTFGFRPGAGTTGQQAASLGGANAAVVSGDQRQQTLDESRAELAAAGRSGVAAELQSAARADAAARMMAPVSFVTGAAGLGAAAKLGAGSTTRLRGAAKGFAADAPFEGVEEAAQSVIGDIAMDRAPDYVAAADAGILGALTGGTMGAAVGAIETPQPAASVPSQTPASAPGVDPQEPVVNQPVDIQGQAASAPGESVSTPAPKPTTVAPVQVAPAVVVNPQDGPFSAALAAGVTDGTLPAAQAGIAQQQAAAQQAQVQDRPQAAVQQPVIDSAGTGSELPAAAPPIPSSELPALDDVVRRYGPGAFTSDTARAISGALGVSVQDVFSARAKYRAEQIRERQAAAEPAAPTGPLPETGASRNENEVDAISSEGGSGRREEVVSAGQEAISWESEPVAGGIAESGSSRQKLIEAPATQKAPEQGRPILSLPKPATPKPSIQKPAKPEVMRAMNRVIGKLDEARAPQVVPMVNKAKLEVSRGAPEKALALVKQALDAVSRMPSTLATKAAKSELEEVAESIQPGVAEPAAITPASGDIAVRRDAAIDAFKSVSSAKFPGRDNPGTAERVVDSLIPAIEAKNADALINMNLQSADSNPGSRAAFEAFTGIKLPKGVAASKRAIDEWAGVTEQQRAEKVAARKAKVEAKKSEREIQAARRTAARVLVKDGDRTIPGDAWVDELIGKGFTRIVRRGPKTLLANEEGRGWPMMHKDIAAYARGRAAIPAPAKAPGAAPSAPSKPAAARDTSPKADRIRELEGWGAEFQAKLDAYDPAAAVTKSRAGSWSFTTVHGTDNPLSFDTKREATGAATRHKELLQDMANNPAGYRDIVSVLARKRLEVIAREQKRGKSEMEAAKVARAEFPEWTEPEPVAAAQASDQPSPSQAAPSAAEPAAPMSSVEAFTTGATHKDPGEPAEPATPEVIAEAAQTAKIAPKVSMKEARVALLKMIDKAIENAPESAANGSAQNPYSRNVGNDLEVWIDRQVYGLDTPTLNIKKDSNGNYSIWYKRQKLDRADTVLSARLLAGRLLLGADWKPTGGLAGTWTFKEVAHENTVSFKVDGDGTFKVINTKERLRAFRKQVEQNFTDKRNSSGLNSLPSIRMSAEKRAQVLAEAERETEAMDAEDAKKPAPKAAEPYTPAPRDETRQLAAPVSSVEGQKNLANRGATIATLTMMNEQIRKLDPAEAWHPDNIADAKDLDALRDNISKTLVRLQREKEQKPAPAPAVAPEIPAGYKPAGEPYYKDGVLTQGYAKFAPGDRVRDTESRYVGEVESPMGQGPVFERLIVKFDNGITATVPGSRLEAAPAVANPGPPPVLAAGFSAMRGHVEDGRRVLVAGDRILTVKSSMSGWELRDETGALVSGPHKSAQAIETAVVAMDAATPSAAEPAERPDIAAIRRDATLDKQTSENGEVMTRRQWVERKVADGLKPKVEQEDRIKPMSRMAYFRATNEEQRAHERKIKEAGKKDVYWIGDYEVTKTEHDYAVGLLASAPAPAAEPDALALTPKQYHDAKLRAMAEANDTTLAEVREMYDTEAGRANNEQEWVERVVAAAQGGTTLTRATLDKLLELRPTTRLPETAIPDGYQRPEARKAEAEAAEAKRDDRRAGPAESEVNAFMTTMRALYAGTATVEDYKAAYRRVKNAEEVKAELGKMTKDDIVRTLGVMRWSGEKKAELVEHAYDSMVNAFALGKEYGPRGFTLVRGGLEQYKKLKAEALDAIVENQTAEGLAAFAAEAKSKRETAEQARSAAAEAIKNPRTLDEYRRFMSYHTRDGKSTTEVRLSMLTPEQRADFDRLLAEESRGRRKVTTDDQRTQVRVAGQTVDGNIIATKHTKKGHDIFVVQLSERVSREDYETLNTGAKKIGGYYSSFRGNGAIPGFQFTTREQAQAFVTLAGGDASAAKEAAQERRDAYADDRSQTAAERLTEMADRMEADADESLSLERKANTARRARFAAAAEAGAREAKAMAKTMRNVAGALTNGKAKFLDRIRTKTQVELLQTYVANAKGEELRAKYPTYAEQEKRKGQPPTMETADYAEFPTFTAFRSDLASLGRQLQEVDGTKKIGDRLMKVADDVSDAFTTWVKEPKNFDSVSTFRTGDGKKAVLPNREAAERAITRSGYKGKAIPWSVKRGEWAIIMSPSEVIAKGIWQGDGDKRITLDPEFGAELVEKIGRANRGGGKVLVPWQFERAYERRKQLQRMGIETPAEFRSALREFIGLREQAAEADRIKMLERAMVGRANDGLDFFPTPESVADEMVAAANVEPGMRVLEPSAGMGHIADRIRAAGAEPEVVEFAADRRDLLEAKGYNVVGTDFIAFTDSDAATRGFTFGDVFRAPDGTLGVLRGSNGMGGSRVGLDPLDDNGQPDARRSRWENFSDLEPVEKRGSASGYDRIVMNPPFSDGRDIEHVRHAYTLLKPGGRIVAIMGEGAFFQQNKRAAEFREWLESLGGTDEKLPAGSFMDPALPVNTGVNARMVVIDKPAGESRVSFSKSEKPTFYSAALRAIRAGAGAPKRADAAAWKGWLDGAVRRGEMKQGERDWLDIDGWLGRQEGPITREALASFVRANEVQVRETVLGRGSFTRSMREELERLSDIRRAERTPEQEARIRELQDLANNEDSVDGGAKFAQYRIPGGENYRELLLTLPVKTTLPDGFSLKQIEAGPRKGQWAVIGPGPLAENRYGTGATQAEAIANFGAHGHNGQTYKSSHWDQPNVLAHVRFDERTDAEGKRVLFVQEIQSDWHQEGRKRGYVGLSADELMRKAALDAKPVQQWSETDFDWYNARVNDAQRDGVPDAPLKATDEWAMLAFKRLARWAVDNGFDRITWATGEQNADVFDLSKQVDRIDYTKTPSGDIIPEIFQIGGGKVPLPKRVYSPDELADVVGKEIAERIANDGNDGSSAKMRSLSGDGLKVGGAGMRGFYDKILPAAVGKWAKKFGARVGTASVRADASESGGGNYRVTRLNSGAFVLRDSDGFDWQGKRFDSESAAREQMAKLLGIKVHAIDITPAMRDAVLAGQPLFSKKSSAPAVDRRLLTQAVESVMATWAKTKAPPVRIVGTAAELPRVIREAPGYDDSVRGARTEDGVYIVADRVPSIQDALKLLAHEAVGHYALETMLGPDRFAKLAQQIGEMKAAGRLPELFAELQQRYGDLDAKTMAQEAMALMAERGITNGLVARVIAAIRAFIRDVLKIQVKLSEADLRAMIANAGRWLKTDAPTSTSAAADVVFSKDGDTADSGIVVEELDFDPAMWAGLLERQRGTADAERQWREQGVDAPAFKRWFGDSKVKRGGKPAKVYHGTRGNFSVFRKADGTSSGMPGSGLGIFTTFSRDAAESYGGRIMELYAKVEKPYKMSQAEFDGFTEVYQSARRREELQAQGYDGVWLPDMDVVVAFDSAQLKSTTNRGTFAAANPDVNFSKMPPDRVVDGIEGALKERAQLGGGILQWVRDKWESAKPSLLGALTLRQLGEVSSRYAPQVSAYAETVQRMQTRRNGLLEDAANQAKAWQDFNAKHRKDGVAEQTANLMHDSTLAGVDGDGPFRPGTITLLSGETLDVSGQAIQDVLAALRTRADSAPAKVKAMLKGEIDRIVEAINVEPSRRAAHAGLRARFQALPEDAKELYRSVRGIYEERGKQWLTALEARLKATEMPDGERTNLLAKVRAHYESARVQAPYFPLARFGEWWVSGTNADGVKRFEMAESPAEQRRVIRQMQLDGFEVTGRGKKLDTARAIDGASGSFMAEVTGIMEQNNVHASVRDEVYQLYLRTLPDLSIRKHFIHRKGTAGYSKDALRAFAAHMTHGSHQLARLEYGKQLENAMDEMRKAAKAAQSNVDSDDAERAAAVYNEMVKRHEWVMNPKDSSAVQALSSANFIYYLGLSPAAAIVNLSQTAITTLPAIASKYGMVKSSAALSRAMAQSIRTLGDMRKALKNEDEIAAYEELLARGDIDRTAAHDLAGIGDTASTAYSPKRHRVMSIISKAFHKAEVVNREASGMAAYRLARADGKSHAEAVQYASDIINQTHFDYSNANRARWMQGNAAKVLFAFKQYAQNMTYFLWRSVHQSLKGADPSIRREARRKLVGTLGMTALFSGVMGLPMMSLMFSIINGLQAAFGDDDEPFDAEVEFRNFLVDYLGEAGAKLAQSGAIQGGMQLAGLPAPAIAERTKLDQLWARPPDQELEGRELANYWLEQIAGPIGAMVIVNPIRAGSLMADGEWQRGVETLVPKAIRDGMKTLRYSTEGVNTMRGDPIVKDLSAAEVALQAAGFSPARVAEAYELRGAMKDYQQQVLNRRQALMDGYAEALRIGDNEATREAVQKIRRFNARWPRITITMNTLRRSIAARRAYSGRAEAGVAFDRRLRGDLGELVRF